MRAQRVWLVLIVATVSCAVAVWLTAHVIPDARWWNLLMLTSLVAVPGRYLWREQQ